jgi:hypothetical protein
MKPFSIFAFAFLIGMFSVYAQDVILMRNGEEIEAKVLEISPLEIRYKRFDNLEGPVMVIPAARVLAIRYENGILEIINDGTSDGQESAQAGKLRTYAMNPDKLTIGVFADPIGFLGYGSIIGAEITKGSLNAELHLIFPSLGMYADSYDAQLTGFIGVGSFLKYFYHSRIGGLYVGAGIEYARLRYESDYYKYEENGNTIAFVTNIGYKFVLPPGLYFRTGIYIGVGWTSFDRRYSNGKEPWEYIAGPDILPVFDLAVGFNF